MNLKRMYWETVRLLRNAAQLRCFVINGGREEVDLQDFSEALLAAIADLTKNQGFVAPLTICTVGANGSVIVSRHVLDDNGKMEAEILSEHHRQDERAGRYWSSVTWNQPLGYGKGMVPCRLPGHIIATP